MGRVLVRRRSWSVEARAAADHVIVGGRAQVPGFEVFNKSMAALRHKPSLTIQRRGAISINKSAHLALGEPAAVELMFDRSQHTLGLRPVDPELSHAYAVRKSAGDNGPYLISAAAFVHFYDIDTTQSLRWEAQVDDDVLYVNLDADATPVTSNRAKPAP